MVWPKLSQTLKHEQSPAICQSCGERATRRWRECDDKDRATAVVVCLCDECSGTIVEPHPRLYREMPVAEPWPGAMGVCIKCVHRQELTCLCPQAQINGGPGLEYEPMPSRAHVCRSPRRLSGWTWLGKRIETCSGFEERDNAEGPELRGADQEEQSSA